MTNLEFYKDELINIIIGNMGVGKDGKPYSCSEFCGDDCIFQKEGNCRMMAKEWLFKEHKEPIKLKQWEFDYLDFTTKSTCAFGIQNTCVRGMKKRGYFMGIPDTAENLEEILSNCIIVADDYEFGDTK